MKTLCIAGKNDIAVNVLDYALRKFGDIEIVAVMNTNETWKDSWQKSAGLYCKNKGIRIVRLEDMYNIKELVFLSVEFDRIIYPSRFASKHLFNIHFSLLPKYKGCSTSVLPILRDESESGVTLHRIRRGIDTGEIIAQRRVEILHDDNSLDLYRKLIDAGSELAVEYLERLISGDFTETPQSLLHSEYFSRREIDYSSLCLDLNRTASQVHNQIRAFAFRPYQLLTFRGHGLIGSRITDTPSSLKPGTILEETETHFTVSTIDYDICIYKDVLDDVISALLRHDDVRAKSLCEYSRLPFDMNSEGFSPIMIAVRENNKDMQEFFAAMTLDNMEAGGYTIPQTADANGLLFNRKIYVFQKKNHYLLWRAFFYGEHRECICAGF